jgi:uncharacterized membrane protein YeaQ/YmgE (transglycosylase-associated protein family)
MCKTIMSGNVGRRVAARVTNRTTARPGKKGIPMDTMTSVIGWVVFGLVAGAIARFLHPGYDRMGMAGTIVLGIVGSLLGGGLAYLLRLGVSPYEPAGWIMSIVGAIILLWMGVLGTRTRTTF